MRTLLAVRIQQFFALDQLESIKKKWEWQTSTQAFVSWHQISQFHSNTSESQFLFSSFSSVYVSLYFPPCSHSLPHPLPRPHLFDGGVVGVEEKFLVGHEVCPERWGSSIQRQRVALAITVTVERTKPKTTSTNSKTKTKQIIRSQL